MPQIRTGQAKVLSSNTKRVQFTGVTTAGMASNHVFKFQSENFIFVIASIISSTEIELVVNYNGAKALDTFFPYAVSVDFTTNARLVKLGAGDVDIRDYWNRNMDRIDQLFDGRWFIENATGDFLPDTDNTRNIGSPTARVKNIYSSGLNLFADGTLGAPSIAFASEATLGFYKQAAGRLGVTGTLTRAPASVGLAGGYKVLKIATPDTGAADFNLIFADDAVFSGTRNNVMYLGYNVAAGGAREDAAEPAIYDTWEHNFNSGSANFLERHVEGVYGDGTTFRAWSLGVNRGTKFIDLGFRADKISIFDRLSGAQLIVFNLQTSATGVLEFNATSWIRHNINNVKLLEQLNAAASAYVELLRLDSSDRVFLAQLGGDIRWGKALVALGGGAAPTLGTIGGSGPATAAQNTWMRVVDSTGAAFWVPAWK